MLLSARFPIVLRVWGEEETGGGKEYDFEDTEFSKSLDGADTVYDSVTGGLYNI